MDTTSHDARAGGVPGSSHSEVQDSPEFIELRRRFRSFIFPMTGLFLGWYFLYVLLAAYAPGFMGTDVVGNINIGLLLGLGQFASTFVIATVYRSWADKKYDTEAARMRDLVEGGSR